MIFNGPADSKRTLVLAHGAGGPMDSPPMESLALGLAGRGVRVARFEFPYMRARRKTGSRRGPDREPVLRATWSEVIEALGGGDNVVAGGRSMGGRIASMVADDHKIRGLICLGYPFHPPGKPEKLRTAHLKNLRTPTLIAQGTRDPFGRPEEIATYSLSRAIRLLWVEDGDHSFKPRRASGRTLEQNLQTVIDAIVVFLSELG